MPVTLRDRPPLKSHAPTPAMGGGKALIVTMLSLLSGNFKWENQQKRQQSPVSLDYREHETSLIQTECKTPHILKS